GRALQQEQCPRYSPLGRLHHRPGRQVRASRLSGTVNLVILNSQLIDQPMQVATSDSERAGTFRFPPVALAKGAQYECALKAFDLIFIGLVERQTLSDGNRYGHLTLRMH